MEKFNIHHAKTHLSQLVEKAAAGEPFIIAKAGKALVKVIPIDAPTKTKPMRLGFMKDEFHVPDDFDTLGADEIDALFGQQR